MPKRKQRPTSTPSRRPSKKTRRGYSSVARTRGGAVRGEMKYFDTSLNQLVSASTTWTSTMVDPTPLTLVVPTVGAGVNQRIGKEIKVMSIKIRGSLTIANAEGAATGIPPNLIRLMLVRDKQTNATQMTGAQLMTPQSANTLAVLSFQNIDNFGRFEVLKDKTIVIEDPNLVGTDTLHDNNGKIRYFKINHKFKFPISMRFNATNGGTVADIVDNSFHLVANNQYTGVSLNYVCRVCYKE